MTKRQVALKKELEDLKNKYNSHCRKSRQYEEKAKRAFGHTAKLIRAKARREQEASTEVKARIIELAREFGNLGAVPTIV